MYILNNIFPSRGIRWFSCNLIECKEKNNEAVSGRPGCNSFFGDQHDKKHVKKEEK